MNTAPNELITFCASPEDEGERLDRFLASKIEGTTRSRLKDLIKAGHVRRQDLVVSSAKYFCNPSLPSETVGK